MKLKVQLRRPTMTRSAWAKDWFNWLALGVLSIVLVVVAPVPTPHMFLLFEVAIVAGFVLHTFWLTVVVRVLPPEPGDNDPNRPGALRVARQWLNHMSGRVAAVRDRLSALGALGALGKGRA
jgi:energy-coupling factor transporter transmembrane protein EcfT